MTAGREGRDGVTADESGSAGDRNPHRLTVTWPARVCLESSLVSDQETMSKPPTNVWLPEGRIIDLPGRGEMFVREHAGPPGAPTVVLLHGWIATAALNWVLAFEPLARHFRIVAPDLRGHGRGIRSRRRFRLADCADDVAHLLDELGVEEAIMVGYSMGGSVAQLMWRRHPEQVAGLVLGATGTEFVRGNRQRYTFAAIMNVLARTTRAGSLISWLPATVVKQIVGMPIGPTNGPMSRWARQEMSGHNVRMVLEAGQAIGTFSSKSWAGDINIPSTVLITLNDTAVLPRAQFRLAMAIPGSRIVRIEGGHISPAHEDFGNILTEACLEVHDRSLAGVQQQAAS